MAFNFSQKDFDKVFVLYQHLVSAAPLYPKMTTSQLNYVARMIGNSVHDLTKIWSGYISVNALSAIVCDNTPLITHDHFLSRLQSGKQIVQMFSEKEFIPFDVFSNMIFQACFVHKITKKENTNLVQLQNAPDYAWNKGYIKVGIDLIYVGDEDGKLPNRLTKSHARRFEHLIT